MRCQHALRMPDETLTCRLAAGHDGYHEDQYGLPLGPWVEQAATNEDAGGCIYCWSSGVIEDYDGDRPCSACRGTGTPTTREGAE